MKPQIPCQPIIAVALLERESPFAKPRWVGARTLTGRTPMVFLSFVRSSVTWLMRSNPDGELRPRIPSSGVSFQGPFDRERWALISVLSLGGRGPHRGSRCNKGAESQKWDVANISVKKYPDQVLEIRILSLDTHRSIQVREEWLLQQLKFLL